MTGRFPLSFHYDMLADRERLAAFSDAIRSVAKRTDVVLDAGAGVGALALIAAPLAKHVYAIEVDRRAAAIAARNFERSAYRDRITLIVGDATEVPPPEAVDVVIAELLDTALLNEQQVAVANFVRASSLRANGVTIPRSVRSWVSLAQCEYRFLDSVELRVAHYERHGHAQSQIRSHEAPLHEVDFASLVPERVNARCLLKCTRSGPVNSVRLRSEAQLSDVISIGTCPTLNVPICVPLQNVEQLTLTRGDELQVSISYRYGSSMDDVVVIAEPN